MKNGLGDISGKKEEFINIEYCVYTVLTTDVYRTYICKQHNSVFILPYLKIIK